MQKKRHEDFYFILKSNPVLNEHSDGGHHHEFEHEGDDANRY